MRAGDLDRQIQIMRAAKWPPAAARQVDIWLPRATAWAAIRPLTGQEIEAGQIPRPEEITRWLMRWRERKLWRTDADADGIHPSDRIRYLDSDVPAFGLDHAIEHIGETRTRREGMEVRTRSTQAVRDRRAGAPGESSTLRDGNEFTVTIERSTIDALEAAAGSTVLGFELRHHGTPMTTYAVQPSRSGDVTLSVDDGGASPMSQALLVAQASATPALWALETSDVGDSKRRAGLPSGLEYIRGMTYHGSPTTLYAITSAGELWTINRSDDSGSLLGTLPRRAGTNDRYTSLVSTVTDLYAVRYGTPYSYLFEVDISTPGTSTSLGEIGSLPNLISPEGAAYDGSTVWMVEESPNRLVQLDNVMAPNGAVEVGALPSGFVHPSGLAWNGTALWGVDEGGGLWEIDTANPGSSTPVPGTWPAAITHPQALAWENVMMAPHMSLWAVTRLGLGTDALSIPVPS